METVTIYPLLLMFSLYVLRSYTTAFLTPEPFIGTLLT